jgi:hypothetical protein
MKQMSKSKTSTNEISIARCARSPSTYLFDRVSLVRVKAQQFLQQVDRGLVRVGEELGKRYAAAFRQRFDERTRLFALNGLDLVRLCEWGSIPKIEKINKSKRI